MLTRLIRQRLKWREHAAFGPFKQDSIARKHGTQFVTSIETPERESKECGCVGAMPHAFSNQSHH